ncbi:MAG: hypothetical protein E2598_08055 [Sphingobium sp.]|nr:hypothetical protein [Sphingobium sp.]
MIAIASSAILRLVISYPLTPLFPVTGESLDVLIIVDEWMASFRSENNDLNDQTIDEPLLMAVNGRHCPPA